MGRLSGACAAIRRSGGLEILFEHKKEHVVRMRRGATMQDLVLHVRDNLVKERPELFSVDGTVCVSRA